MRQLQGTECKMRFMVVAWDINAHCVCDSECCISESRRLIIPDDASDRATKDLGKHSMEISYCITR